MTAVYIIIAILVFFFLIFVHELGHFFCAKITDIQVNEFALGMGPKLFGFKRGETEWTIRALPIGGACMMEGEEDESTNPRAFTSKSARARALVLFGGPLMNILVAIVTLAMVIFAVNIAGYDGPFINGFLFFFKSFGYGAQYAVELMRMMLETLAQLVTGAVSVDNLTGPVGIVATVSDTAKETVQTGTPVLWQIAAFISLNLGIVNLLPFPALDGGRLLFLAIRKLTGKRVTDKMENIVHLVGICLLFAFMLFITFKDVGRLIGN